VSYPSKEEKKLQAELLLAEPLIRGYANGLRTDFNGLRRLGPDHPRQSVSKGYIRVNGGPHTRSMSCSITIRMHRRERAQPAIPGYAGVAGKHGLIRRENLCMHCGPREVAH
jgi:hypothetical protein